MRRNVRILHSLAAISVIGFAAVLMVPSQAWAQDGTDGSNAADPEQQGTNQQGATGEPQTAALEERIETLEAELETVKASLLETRGLAEAQTPEIGGRSRLIFEGDLLTGGTAFENKNEVDIRVQFASGTEVGRYRGSGLTAMISIYKFNVSATEEGIEVNDGAIDARLMWGDYYLLLSDAPDFLLDLAPPVSSRPENVRTNAVTAEGGLTFGREARGSALSFKLGSYDDDARQNFKNRYGVGVNWEQRLIPQLLNIEAGLTYGTELGYIRSEDSNFTSRDIGFSLRPVLLVEGLGQGIRINFGSDLLLPYQIIQGEYGDPLYDLRIDTELYLSEEGVLDDGSRDRSRIRGGIYAIPQERIIDVQATLVELPGDAGFLPVVGGDVTVALLDVIGNDLGYELGGGVRIEAGETITPFARSVYRSETGKVSLTLGTDVQPLDELTITAEYVSDYINDSDEGDMGVLRFETSLEY